MVTKKIKVKLENGLHARPSAFIIKQMGPLSLDKATMTCKDHTVDLKSILSLMTLYVIKGSEVIVELSGPDELKALKILEDILHGKNNDEIY